ncbi:MAG TPA: class I SAM-dependent methyltransferase [Polyangiaceae bacterium]|nr:class I SAM-dependent methyltransferase [Polyangiaceae bacterium]
MNGTRAEHRAFLNRYYGVSRLFYDLTRKYYLFGRDATLRELARDDRWQSLIEVGPGTGRNLRQLHKARPTARLAGIEASDVMLAHARARCPWALLEHGFAEDARLRELLDAPPDRILFSYCLSMVEDRRAALTNARRALGDRGEVVVVDFGDLAGIPAPLADVFRNYLRAFHVVPLDGASLQEARSVRWGPGRYSVFARFAPLAS